MADQTVNKALYETELKKCFQKLIEIECNKNPNHIYTKQFKMALTDSTLNFLDHLISKLNYFASHAKRKKINVDDVLLYFRARPVMMDLLKETINDESSDEMSVANSSILPLTDKSR